MAARTYALAHSTFSAAGRHGQKQEQNQPDDR
jgi:hypothetical protein